VLLLFTIGRIAILAVGSLLVSKILQIRSAAFPSPYGNTLLLQHIASSKNLRFHGRFHIAYMLEEDYVSVWDDDMLPRTEWLAYCVDYSRTNGHGLESLYFP
jgi:hypothetical protein